MICKFFFINESIIFQLGDMLCSMFDHMIHDYLLELGSSFSLI